jgi:hypothetical protein
MTATTDEPTKVPGNLDIARLFQAEALSLFEAVERGKLLHGTKNIRDSGGPLEVRLRKLLADRMPRGTQVGHGYLYDVDSNCTPQVDGLLLSEQDNHTMMTTEDGAIYAPFTSALAVLEIKSSVGDMVKQLQQTKEIVLRTRKMAEELRQRRTGAGAVLAAPLSVLFYATSKDAKLSSLRDWYAQNGWPTPTYVVFLDRACIVAQRHLSSELLDFGEPLPVGFDDHRNPAARCLCAPQDEDAYASGRTLLWLYFTLLNAASQFNGNLRPASDFIRDASKRFALKVVAELESSNDWPASLVPRG